MTGHRGGEMVEPGLYWSRRDWEIVTVSGTRGALPGDGAARYVRLPKLLMLVLAPVMGGLFVVFLPLVGFAIVLTHLGGRAARLMRRALASALAAVKRSLPHGV